MLRKVNVTDKAFPSSVDRKDGFDAINANNIFQSTTTNI